MNVSDDVFKTKLSEFLAENAGKLEVLSGAASKQLVIAGKAVTTSSSKVSTILGRFTPDIEDLFNELGSFKNVGLGEVKGGINILNKPDYYTKLADWWEVFNKPWLTKAIERGDDIYLATIPRKVEDLIDGAGNLKGAYARELDLLASKKYKPVNITQEEWADILIWLKKSEVIGGGNLVEVTLNGKVIGKFIRGNSLEIIDDAIYGGNRISLAKNKTTTVTGTLDDVNTVAKRGVNADGTFNGITNANTANVGGINILRSPKWSEIKLKYKSVVNGQTTYDWNKIADEFWETVNKPWLENAIARGDNFRFVSSPTNSKAIHVTDDIGNFVLDASGNKIKSIFGREIDYLKSKGYTFLSDGTAIK